MTVHYACLKRLTGAEKVADGFRHDPEFDLHQMTADLCGIKRKQAKEVFLGICYGMGGAKLCRKLGLPTESIFSTRQGKWIDVAGAAGQELLDKFHAMVPFARGLANAAKNRANSVGYVKTIMGRRCRFESDGKEWMYTHKALNRIIQGSSADQTKLAMVEAEAAGLRLQLQVHDELDMTISSRNEAYRLRDIMVGCMELLVPSKVDLEIGPSWGRAEKEKVA